MPIIGITGGIASGKSSFRKLLLERVEADCFDADAQAREMLDEDPLVREQITSQIHPDSYDAEKQPNRALLRELIYQDASKKRTLEAILHPLIRERWSRQARESTSQGRMFVVDIPLLFETKAEGLFDRIVTVACSREKQMARLEASRNLAKEVSEKIIASQLPQGIKIAKSHHVVWNDGSLAALVEQADLFSHYLNDRYG